MNASKSIALVAAMFVTAAGMTGIVRYTDGAVSANQGVEATTETIQTLPAVNVHPTNAQLRLLHGDRPGAAAANVRMPYYSFASDDSVGA